MSTQGERKSASYKEHNDADNLQQSVNEADSIFETTCVAIFPPCSLVFLCLHLLLHRFSACCTELPRCGVNLHAINPSSQPSLVIQTRDSSICSIKITKMQKDTEINIKILIKKKNCGNFNLFTELITISHYCYFLINRNKKKELNTSNLFLQTIK